VTATLIPARMFLLSTGLAVFRAPCPRHRMLSFALLGGAMGLVGGLSPVSALLALFVIVEDARQSNHQQRALYEIATGRRRVP
jgi:hypothetical protein